MRCPQSILLEDVVKIQMKMSCQLVDGLSSTDVHVIQTKNVLITVHEVYGSGLQGHVLLNKREASVRCDWRVERSSEHIESHI